MGLLSLGNYEEVNIITKFRSNLKLTLKEFYYEFILYYYYTQFYYLNCMFNSFSYRKPNFAEFLFITTFPTKYSKQTNQKI